MSWVDGFVFAEPMIDLRDEPRRAELLAAELRRELGPAHPLAGTQWTVVAEAEPQDDVLVVTAMGVAMVHLTWSGNTESLPWPREYDLPDPAALDRLIIERY
ncbi:hypothetical protein [Microbacterium azadirachtae]|uniref:hypothetical protein n=1 Tax=Microbacterium azadirachtae TaxID=582680 RepID=UPI000696C41F|nr:hypothetical protein [Microbacterium azadirachtae]